MIKIPPSNLVLDKALEGIEVILLLGGPLGSGKTTFAERLIRGSETSSFLQGYRGSLSRTEAKSLPRKTFMPGGLIVEFGTNQLHEPEQYLSTRVYIAAIQRRANVVGAHTLEVSGWHLYRRYLERMHGLQFLHLGKLKTLAHYALRREAQHGVASWKSLLAECGIENRPVEHRSQAAISTAFSGMR